jgi:signal transduction histidine kinase
VLIAQEICEDVQPGWVDTFRSLYFILPGPATMGFDPLIARWAWQTPGDYELDAEEWVKEAQPERNPSRGVVWTGVFVDTPSGKPFVTVQLPVDKDGVQIATVAHDTHIDQLFDEIAHSDSPGATHLIFRPDGRLIAHPAYREKILATNGAVTCENSGDASLASLYRRATANTARHFSGFEPVSQSYFSASRFSGSEWYFVTLMPRAFVAEQAFASAKWVWLFGIASLGLLFAVFAGIFRRLVTRPLGALTQATKAMAAGASDVSVSLHRDDELGALADAFREMVEKVAAREGDLRQLNLELEKRVADRTAELEVALAQQTELAKLKTDFVSLVSHEFRTPLGVIMSAADVLNRYFDRLPTEKRTRHLGMILQSTRNLATLIEEILLLGRVEEGRMHFTPVGVDLERSCRCLCDQVLSAMASSPRIHFRVANTLAGAVSDESLLRHILTNLLSNALKYSDPGEAVDFTIERRGVDAVFTIRDRGIGIPQEDRARLFTSFTRGANVGSRPGTGLGLVVVQRCVQLHGGSVGVESEVGRGTTITVTLPVYPGTPPS